MMTKLCGAKWPEVTPVPGAMHPGLQEQDGPVVVSFLTAPKKGISQP